LIVPQADEQALAHLERVQLEAALILYGMI
jgi:hypothetical protein